MNIDQLIDKRIAYLDTIFQKQKGKTFQEAAQEQQKEYEVQRRNIELSMRRMENDYSIAHSRGDIVTMKRLADAYDKARTKLSSLSRSFDVYNREIQTISSSWELFLFINSVGTFVWNSFEGATPVDVQIILKNLGYNSNSASFRIHFREIFTYAKELSMGIEHFISCPCLFVENNN